MLSTCFLRASKIFAMDRDYCRTGYQLESEVLAIALLLEIDRSRHYAESNVCTVEKCSS